MALARQMRARGHDTCIISLIPVGALGADTEKFGIPTYSLGMCPGVPDPRGLARLANIIRRWRPDVLHSHMVHANILGRLVRLFAPVPVLVSTVHSIHEGGALRMAAYRLTDGLTDLTTTISEAAADRFLRLKAVSRVRVIPNGVDLQQFRLRADRNAMLRNALAPGSEFVWLAVGRLEVEKDYPTMLKAASQVLHDVKHTLLLVGDGSLRENLEQLAQELRLSGRVRFLGMRQDVADLMGSADAYVMSSAWEGLPVVLLEAAAAGLPIVATQVGGNEEIVRGEVNGFIVPAGNSDSLAAAMLRLMALPESERRNMALRGREHVCQHFGLNMIATLWERTYEELAQVRRAGRQPVSQ